MKLYYLLLLAVFVVACEKDDDPVQCETEINTYTVTNDRALKDTMVLQGNEQLLYVKEIPGSRQLFIYKSTLYACPGVADAGYEYNLLFTVPKGTTQFRFDDTNIAMADCYYRVYVFGPNAGTTRVTEGSIEGEMISPNHWKVSVNVTLHYRTTAIEKLRFEQIYEVAK